MITALEYLKIKNRMTNTCKINCDDCAFYFENSGENIGCRRFELKFPERVIEIVEQWGKEHPEKTFLSDFLEKYPNAELGEDGTPESICPSSLGLENIKNKTECYSDDCIACWKQELKEQ